MARLEQKVLMQEIVQAIDFNSMSNFEKRCIMKVTGLGMILCMTRRIK